MVVTENPPDNGDTVMRGWLDLTNETQTHYGQSITIPKHSVATTDVRIFQAWEHHSVYHLEFRGFIGLIP